MNLIKRLYRALFPTRYWNSRLDFFRASRCEDELKLVPALASNGGLAVDIGAAEGVYVAHMLMTVKNVIAFEPRSRQAKDLREMGTYLRLPLQVEEVALSNSTGVATLRMLANDLGRSTVDPGNTLDDPDGSPMVEVQVKLKQLDEYALSDVGLIKIDVEGHELAVLEGACSTIASNRPNILIEVEERHHAGAVFAVFDRLRVKGYSGYFLLNQSLVRVENFDLGVHQRSENIGGWKSGWKRHGLYINNFIFVPQERTAKFVDLAQSSGFSFAQ